MCRLASDTTLHSGFGLYGFWRRAACCMHVPWLVITIIMGTSQSEQLMCYFSWLSRYHLITSASASVCACLHPHPHPVTTLAPPILRIQCEYFCSQPNMALCCRVRLVSVSAAHECAARLLHSCARCVVSLRLPSTITTNRQEGSHAATSRLSLQENNNV